MTDLKKGPVELPNGMILFARDNGTGLASLYIDYSTIKDEHGVSKKAQAIGKVLETFLNREGLRPSEPVHFEDNERLIYDFLARGEEEAETVVNTISRAIDMALPELRHTLTVKQHSSSKEKH